jgi:hypothetical protein
MKEKARERARKARRVRKARKEKRAKKAKRERNTTTRFTYLNVTSAKHCT